jgi:hypothetical protein
MATDDDIQKMVSKETQSMARAEVGINADTTDLKNITDALKKAKEEGERLAVSLGKAVQAMKSLKEMGLVQVYDQSAHWSGGQGGAGGAGQLSVGSTPVAGAKPSHPAPVVPAPNAVVAAGGASPGVSAVTAGSPIGSGFGGQFLRGAAGAAAPGVPGILGGGGTGAIGTSGQLGAGGFGAGNIGAIVGSLGSQIVQAIDKRVESGRAYTLAADKSTLVMQQLTGMSQSGVMNNLRMPLTQYKLGVNGINEMMDLQARTGINAAGQARSVEFMRTLSGFTMGAAGATGIIESLADPETVNKMFMMTGMSLIGPGGKQRSTQSLIENLAKRAGLMDPKLAATAMAPGSVSRATLSQMGVTGDMQEQVLRFAQSNAAFRKRGGQGTYDPTKEEDRKLMGIDDTFAMEAEETQRRRGKREEQFYRDQADAYAKLERQTQRLTDAMAKFEHAMEGIIGARTGSRVGQKLLGGLAGAGGMGLLGMGMATLATGGAAGGLLLGGTFLSGLGKILGDPNTSDDFASSIWTPRSSSSTVVGSSMATTPAGTPSVPPPAAPATPIAEAAPLNLWTAGEATAHRTALTATFSEDFLATQYSRNPEHTIKNSGEFNELNGALRKSINSMADRAMVEAGLDINLVSGRRSTDEQIQLFLERYQVAPAGVKEYRDAFDGKYYKVKNYNGANWMKKPQNTDPPVAVPGTSLHEIGMAADIDLSDPRVAQWVRNNKWRFNLVNGEGEEHHLQLAWTKDMSLPQFLGKTALSLEEASKNTHVAMSGSRRYTTSFRPGFGVDINKFSEALLRRWGYTITPEKIMLLRSWSDKEGTGGSYNPMNVVSGNNRVDPATGYERAETNYNVNGGGLFPVQNFDSFQQGVEYTALHLGTNNSAIMSVLSQPNPTADEIRSVLSAVGRTTMLNIFNGYAERAQGAGYGINEAYNMTGTSGVQQLISNMNAGKKMAGFAGDPQVSSSSRSITSSPIMMSNSVTPTSTVGTPSVINQGSTVTISPVINMTTTGNSGSVSEYDLRLMAKRLAKLIEQETNLDKIRRS